MPCGTASIKKPIHNVKERANPATIAGKAKARPANSCLHTWSYLNSAASNHSIPRSGENGGAYRDRTDDPLLAKQVLSQLS
jgi:hypothetical protein